MLIVQRLLRTCRSCSSFSNAKTPLNLVGVSGSWRVESYLSGQCTPRHSGLFWSSSRRRSVSTRELYDDIDKPATSDSTLHTKNQSSFASPSGTLKVDGMVESVGTFEMGDEALVPEMQLRNWDREAEEQILHDRDKRGRERASMEAGSIRSVEPPKALLEDASRHLLRELLEQDIAFGGKYKKGTSTETTSDYLLLQQALDASVMRIKENPKPGYHSLPFYIHRNSKLLDQSLSNILRTKHPGMVNKVCYNLLVSDSAPSILTFNLLLRRFTKFRLTGLAHTILTTLFAVGFEPNAQTYAALLQYLIVVGNYDAFGRAVTIMRNSFVDYRNPVLASVEMNGWSKFGDFMSMRRRLRLLHEEGLRDHIYVLTVELRYFAKRHMWEGGLPALRALLQKKSHEIDHRALFWAWKLCANCHQDDFVERLKLLTQEKRWPVEALWTRPSRSRGLVYGYKGKESGQVLSAEPENPPIPRKSRYSRDAKRSIELDRLLIRASPTVPLSWNGYRSVLDRYINSKDIHMESRIDAIPENKSLDENSGLNYTAGTDGHSTVTQGETDGTEIRTPTRPRNPSGPSFSAMSPSNSWRLLIRSRKQELLDSKKK